MNAGSLVELSAIDLVKGFASGAFTPSDLVEACLARIADVGPAVNALTVVDAQRGRAEAAAATKRWREGRPLGPLDGLPIGVKDLQDAEGLLTTHGSPRFRSNVAQADLLMVARLRAAGAIVLAKTNVPEFGAGGNSRNPVWGATGNPFDPRRLAGGSSGGSAAALAVDLLPLCTGSDTGGSLRLPAALCGVVGYRPSADVVAHPARPLGWSTISVLGPMARDMGDLVMMLNVIQGQDPDDPLSAPSAPDRFARISPAALSGLRVGYSEDFGGAAVDPGIREVFRRRVAAIAPHVAECRPLDMNLGDMDRAFDILRAESFLAAFDKAFAEAPETFGPHIAANVELGRGMSLADRAWAHLEQTRILRAFNARMREVDIVLMPTVPVSPFPWSEHYPAQIDGRTMDIYYRWLSLTYRGSLSGGPALTLPAGLDGEGMPFGLQVLGRVRGDEDLLAAGFALEALLACDPETARPRPDLDRLRTARADLTSIVTHPADGTGTRPAAAAATAV
jgi:Asp-tRNA(Asn)/Glu-tRNA(Gln) amidotransferase A subunit family amidase